MRRKKDSGHNLTRSSGFTIVELLIVVVVIAILAAITIIAYNGIQNRAKIAAVKSSAESIGKKLETYKVQNNDTYPATQTDAETYLGASTHLAAYLVDVPSTPKNYCATISDTSTSPATSFSYSSTSSGVVAGECITNLVTNPKLAGGSSTNYALNGAASPQVVAVSDLTGFANAYSATATASGDRIYYQKGSIVTNGDTYTVSAFGKLAVPGASIGLQFADSSGTSYGPVTQVVATGGWQHLYATAATASTSVRIAIRQVGGSGTGTIAMTGLMMTTGSTQYAYGDGDSPGWFWLDPANPNNSASIGPSVVQ